MKAMTVTGPVDVAELGVTLPHEHLLLDLRNQFRDPADPGERRRSHEPLSESNVAAARRNPYAIRDNLLLDDLDVAIEEITAFQTLGGRTVVDCTSVGICRDPRRLREISLRTGLNVIAGCGYYTHDTHPPEMDAWTADDIAGQMIRDLTEGIDGTGIRAGVIGEIGASFPLHANEHKSLMASAIAFRETGVAIQVHTYPWSQVGLEAIEILLRGRVVPEKIVICHADVPLEMDYIRAMLRQGVFVEFDNFGKEFLLESDKQGFAGGSFARDGQRIEALKLLLDEGFAKQLLLTTDVCLKCLLRRHGGRGYAHVLETIVPALRGRGVDEKTLEILIQGNPCRLYGQ